MTFIPFLGKCLINTQQIESMIYNEKDGRGFSTLSVNMASGYIHRTESAPGDNTTTEIYNKIISATGPQVGLSSYEIARGIKIAKYGDGPHSL